MIDVLKLTDSIVMVFDDLSYDKIFLQKLFLWGVNAEVLYILEEQSPENRLIE